MWRACLLTGFSLLSSSLCAMTIALTFDDAPRGDEKFYTGLQRTEALIKVLKDHKLQAAFFCNTRAFDATQEKRLELYSKAGHILANHTAQHLDFDGPETSYQEFTRQVLETDLQLNRFKGFRRWFRFPYLRQGDRTQQRDKIDRFLATNMYRHGYVTVETYDFYLNHLVQHDSKILPKSDLSRIKAMYLKMIWEGIAFYDELAQTTLKRSPKHVLLLHENDLNALFLGDLIALLQLKGHTVIGITDAYQDPIADVKWDTLPYSQRRLRAMARYYKYKGSLVSRWEDEAEIDKLYAGWQIGSR